MRTKSIAADRVASGLSITQLAERTGVPAPTLRSWEARYGAPRPRRLPSGRRRYSEQDVGFVEDVLRLRAAGLGVATAIDRASARASQPESSVFAGLRRRHPELTTRCVRKGTLLALTRAIEDECCARAQQPVLFGSFQAERFYSAAQRRWAELARTARAVAVFADFPAPPTPGASPLTIPVPADAVLRREWAVICDAADLPGCVAGWELPGQAGVADSDRRFEAVWSVDPQVVRDAAHIGAALADVFVPGLGDLLSVVLTGVPSPASADLRRAASVLDRMIGYVEAAY